MYTLLSEILSSSLTPQQRMLASKALLSVVLMTQYSLPFFVFFTFTSLGMNPDQLQVGVVLADGRTATSHQVVLDFLWHNLVDWEDARERCEVL